MTTYRGRGYQRVMHEDVVIPLTTLYDTILLAWIRWGKRLFNATQTYDFSDQIIVEGQSLIGMNDFRRSKAVSAADVVLVGNSSTHLEKASMITRIYSLPFASLVSGPIWSRWWTSMNSDIMRSVIPLSPGRWCLSLSRRLQMSNPHWPTLELWVLDNLAWMSGGNTITGLRATMCLSAKVGGGGILFVHNLHWESWRHMMCWKRHICRKRRLFLLFSTVQECFVKRRLFCLPSTVRK